MGLVDSSSVGRSPGELSVDELGARIVDGSGRLAAATCRWLLLVADFDARQGYLAFGLASTAQWLCHACGIAHRTAVEHVRVARSLRHYPQLADEMAAGRLSFSQVRAISRVAGPGEDGLVDDLIEAARYATVTHFEVVVRGWTEAAGLTLDEAFDLFPPGLLRHVLVTDVGRDGALTGANRELIAQINGTRQVG